MSKRFAVQLGGCALIVLLSACSSGSGVPPDNGGNGDGGDGNGGGGDGGGGDGGGGEPPPPPSPFTAPTEQQALYFRNIMPDDLDLVKDSYNTGGRTTFDNLPTGSIAYNGFMELLFLSDPGATITSPATLTLDLQTGETSGGATEFMGYVQNNETETTELALYEGGVQFISGSVTADGSNRANLVLGIEGSFANGVQDFTISGNIDGPIYGPAAEGIFATGSYFGLGEEITLTADNVQVYGTATLWALQD